MNYVNFYDLHDFLGNEFHLPILNMNINLKLRTILFQINKNELEMPIKKFSEQGKHLFFMKHIKT